jgi:hypothetical protein
MSEFVPLLIFTFAGLRTRLTGWKVLGADGLVTRDSSTTSPPPILSSVKRLTPALSHLQERSTTQLRLARFVPTG